MSGAIEELRRVEEALVTKAGRRAGRLSRTREGCEFVYLSDYDGPAVATTLPLGAAAVRTSAGAVPPFFAGLLPEGRRLAAVRAAVKTSADDDFSLLLATAHEAIGDVQVLAVGWEPPPSPVPDSLETVENELFFLNAARASGVPAASAELVHDRDGEPGLLVRRFDRVLHEGVWRPLAQEDGCQVLGRYPADKYRVSSEEVLATLTRVAGAPRVCARDLLRQIAFAYLSCNGDAHAKNFSVRRAPDGEWEATPAYDVPSSHLYGDHSMALSINGKTREDIGRSDLLALAAVLDLPTRAAARVLDELVDAVPLWLARLDELPFDARKVNKLRRAVEFRRERLGA